MFRLLIIECRPGQWAHCEIRQDRRWYIVYEKSPIPGQPERPVLSRQDEHLAESEAILYLKKRGSLFQAERSVVGA